MGVTGRAGTELGAVLQVDGLCFSAGVRTLFTAWSRQFVPGVTLVQGGEGSGKTSLLRLLAGTLAAQSGHIAIHGVALATQPAAYRQQVFLADARSEAFDQTSAMTYFASLRMRYADFDDKLLGPLLDGLSLSEHRDKPLYMLSTGSKRKVWLAAAFACRAAVTLLDEPFAALDKPSIRFVLDQLDAASRDPARTWVVADYEAPAGVLLAGVIDLG